MCLYHEAQHQERHGFIKNTILFLYYHPKYFWCFKPHCTAGRLVYSSAIILEGTSSKDIILTHICTHVYMHIISIVCVIYKYLHLLTKNLESLEEYRPEVSLLPVCV